ncbi:MAG: Kelch repeat-containing protein, partial [Kofleriaceae bacterium]
MRGVLLALALVACGDNKTQPDAARDAASDAASDAAVDATIDATVDAASFCGDGVVDLGEGCDEGLRGLSNDGCSSTCQVETLTFTFPTRETMVPRRSHAMAYDSSRQRVVLFGGRVGVGVGTLNDETWERVGTSWQQRTDSVHPSARANAVMFYEQGRVILFGGIGDNNERFDDTWALDGNGWTQLAPANVPTGGFAGAYDPQRDVGVLVASTGTWEWSDDNWNLVTASIPPCTTASYAGQGRVACIDQRWTSFWDGSTWTTTEAELLRSGATVSGAAHDSVHDRLVTVYPDGTTWGLKLLRWTGSDWATIPTTGDMPARSRETPLVFDDTNGELVLHGGGSLLVDTWAFDGTWHQDHASVPPPRGWSAMELDIRAGHTVMFSGVASTTLRDDLWTYRAGQWQSVDLATRPPPRVGAAHAYDEKRSKLVVWGGQINMDPAVVLHGDDLWELDANGWQHRVDAGIDGVETFGAGAAYDRTHGYTMFVNTQTWTWDGSALVERTPPPSGQGLSSIAFDAKRGVMVLCKVDDASHTFYEWTGATWQSRGPQAHSGYLFYDPQRAKVIVRDYADGTVWEWDGNAVSQIGANQGRAIDTVYDRRSHAWFSFGGASGWDTTIARWQSSEQDERCDGSDADLDGLVRC